MSEAHLLFKTALSSSFESRPNVFLARALHFIEWRFDLVGDFLGYLYRLAGKSSCKSHTKSLHTLEKGGTAWFLSDLSFFVKNFMFRHNPNIKCIVENGPIPPMLTDKVSSFFSSRKPVQPHPVSTFKRV